MEVGVRYILIIIYVKTSEYPKIVSKTPFSRGSLLKARIDSLVRTTDFKMSKSVAII